MKANELQNKSVSQLKEELVMLLKEQFNLRMQRATGQPPKPHLLKLARRNIARVKTILQQKDIK